MDDATLAKTCTRCTTEKLLTAFPRQKRGLYGRSSRCTSCFAAIVREQRAADPAKFRERERLYRENNLERVRAKVRRAGIRYRSRHGGVKGSEKAYIRNRDRLTEAAQAAWRAAGRITICKVCEREFCPLRGKQSHMKHCSAECSKVSDRRMRVAKEKVRKHRKRGIAAEMVDPFRVFDRDGWRCQLCGCKVRPEDRGTSKARAPELDHIVPLAAGGAHSYLNTQCSCHKCNNAKRAKVIGQMRLFG